MLKSVHDARRFSAGAIQTNMGAPLCDPDRPATVGPFAMVAHALPFGIEPGALPVDFDVRPHPHIGLAALTYMLEGQVTHRDSLGSRAEVRPGDISFMVAGRGVTHSERFDRLRVQGGQLELLQILLALPDGHEEVEPSFRHVDAKQVHETHGDGATVRVLSESVAFPAPLFLHDVQLEAGGRYASPDTHPERALFVLHGSVEVDGTPVNSGQIALLSAGESLASSAEPARLLAYGGEPVGPRYMWWNYIHSSIERLEAARAEWRAGENPLPPGDTESFTPAPPDDGRPLVVLNARD